MARLQHPLDGTPRKPVDAPSLLPVVKHQSWMKIPVFCPLLCAVNPTKNFLDAEVSGGGLRAWQMSTPCCKRAGVEGFSSPSDTNTEREEAAKSIHTNTALLLVMGKGGEAVATDLMLPPVLMPMWLAFGSPISREKSNSTAKPVPVLA